MPKLRYCKVLIILVFFAYNCIAAMSTIKVNRIKSYLNKSFREKIDISDLQKKNDEEKEMQFLSRELASYALSIEAIVDTEDSGRAVTDGYDDNGLDAIYFDRQTKKLWLVQSKFINKGTGGIDNGDVEKFCKGVKKLIDGDFSRFNQKIVDRQDEILEALEDASVTIQIIFAYTGKELSTHNWDSINDLLEEQNDTDEILFFTDFNIEKAYKGLETGIGTAPINEDVLISNWGHIEEPLKSYYGQISGTDLSLLWEKYGRRLFTENIRSFLGNSSVNDEIIKTIKNEPKNFLYFNNGITILCENIRKKRIGGGDKSIGSFSCNGIAVVNGAQTLGAIGSLANSCPEQLGETKVLVRFISLEDTPAGFGQRITIATNTQNKVERKDFISLDGEQERIKLELKLENIDYHYKRTDEKVTANESNFLLEEVAFALAAHWKNVDYSTMIKKESGRLWEDVEKAPYTDLFNPNVTAYKVIKAVRIYRYVSEEMSNLAREKEGRERSIYRYGNSFICHIIFQKMEQKIWADSYGQFEHFFTKVLPVLTKYYVKVLYNTIEEEYPESMVVYVLRNYTKCRDLKGIISKFSIKKTEVEV